MEGHEVQEENKFLYEKYGIGVEVQDKLLKYENELDNKKKSLESEIESLKRLTDEKYNTLRLSKADLLYQLQMKVENNLKDKFDYNAKVHILQQEIQTNIDVLNKERDQYNDIIKTNSMYEESIISTDRTLSEINCKIESDIKEVNYLKKDISDNCLNYQVLKGKVEFLLKKLSNINRNNLSITEFIEKSIQNISEKKDNVVERDKKLDSALFYKNKVVQTLKELNTVKKYLEIEKKSE
jgi:hypothetical protein